MIARDPEHLITDYLNDELNHVDGLTLERWLLESDRHIDLFLRTCHLHGAIYRLLAGGNLCFKDAVANQAPAVPIGEQSPARWASRVPGQFMWAALVLIGVCIGAALYPTLVSTSSRTGPVSSVASDHYAVLVNSMDAVWSPIGSPPTDSAALGAGLLHLESGSATIRFNDGALATLSGHSVMHIDGKRQATLRRGVVEVQLGPSSTGFTLFTPVATIVDLGTALSVTVEPSGDTAVRVIEGVVEVLPHDGSAGTQLTAGQSINLSPAHIEHHDIGLDEDGADPTSDTEGEGHGAPSEETGPVTHPEANTDPRIRQELIGPNSAPK